MLGESFCLTLLIGRGQSVRGSAAQQNLEPYLAGTVQNAAQQIRAKNEGREPVPIEISGQQVMGRVVLFSVVASVVHPGRELRCLQLLLVYPDRMNE